MADYGKQKSGKPGANRPPHREHNAPGGPANPFGAKADKAALLRRMKDAAQRGRTAGTEPGAGPDDSSDEPAVRSEGDA